ncbi:hypothetical protein Pmani_009110 [Petrolisthes manimaculis]|uniref:Uncharacterized protein n=1 Tax=Petrolisthes manimaculis TaxID=1843537 RepID=A0AAE1UH12_9EUCA|nr:hypothetical protein Pmani_009110 [Petrolisthes manimaculis]
MKQGVWGKFARPQRRKDRREKNLDAVLDNLFTNRYKRNYRRAVSKQTESPSKISSHGSESKNQPNTNQSSQTKSDPGNKRRSEDSILDVYKGRNNAQLKNQWSHSSGRQSIKTRSLNMMVDRIASQLNTFGTSLGKPTWERTFSPVQKKGQLDDHTPSWLKSYLVPVNPTTKDHNILKQRCSSIEWGFPDENGKHRGRIVFSEENLTK